jgi:hypothetical protein
LAGPVEPDDGYSDLGQRKKEVVKFFHKRIVSAGEDERAPFLPFGLQPKTREMSARVRNLDVLVSGDPFHSERPRPRKVIVEGVANIPGGQIKLGAVIVGRCVQPPLLRLGSLREPKPRRVPAVVILDRRRNSADLLQAGRRGAIQQRPVQRVVHSGIRKKVHVWHRASPQTCDPDHEAAIRERSFDSISGQRNTNPGG